MSLGKHFSMGLRQVCATAVFLPRRACVPRQRLHTTRVVSERAGQDYPNVFCDFAIYKGKSAAQFKVASRTHLPDHTFMPPFDVECIRMHKRQGSVFGLLSQKFDSFPSMMLV